jgi:adenine/guanine phosphoribosyltransferase-like PRPP-binding protein
MPVVTQYSHADYMKLTMKPDTLAQMVGMCEAFLRGKMGVQIPDYDALAFSGCSGIMLGSPLSIMLDKPFILVRKHSECHSDQKCEGYIAAKKYIIVDDFVASATTVNNIRDRIALWSPHADLVGVLESCRLLEDKPPYWHTKFPWGRRP